MAATLRNVTVDCTDALGLGRFWAAVLGWNVYYDDQEPPVLVAPQFPQPGNGPGMLFIPVPEPRTVKNRVHVDVQPSDRTREEEVERLLTLGATIVEDHRTEEGGGWVWMADPEGNDFCVERSAGERAAAAKPRVFRLAVEQ
ncbi:MAG TPA: VOC family protein [Jatrophihabitans sp.]|jgi:predicted enzyme related to lactoylglutathione lyase|nr:VOC family protein [Jatrophihabitans sp.]